MFVSSNDTERKKEGMQISVKAARVNAKKTQKEAANFLKMSLTQYQRKENGQVRFYADELAKLSKYYDVPLLFFFESQCHNETQEKSF